MSQYYKCVYKTEQNRTEQSRTEQSRRAETAGRVESRGSRGAEIEKTAIEKKCTFVHGDTCWWHVHVHVCMDVCVSLCVALR